jgi:hypothetical protein
MSSLAGGCAASHRRNSESTPSWSHYVSWPPEWGLKPRAPIARRDLADRAPGEGRRPGRGAKSRWWSARATGQTADIGTKQYVLMAGARA